MNEWERIDSRGRLIYWRLRLADRWYVVQRSRGTDRWMWQLRQHGPGRPGVLLAEGSRSTSTLARAAAERHCAFGSDDARRPGTRKSQHYPRFDTSICPNPDACKWLFHFELAPGDCCECCGGVVP